MKYNLIKAWGLAALPTLFLLYGCGKADEAEPLPTADFYIYENFGFSGEFADIWKPYDTDSLSSTDVLFKVAQPFEGVEYRWHIGADEYEGTSVSLGVGGLRKVTMEASLTATIPVAGTDSSYHLSKTRTFYLDRAATGITDGRYLGYLTDQPNKKFEVYVDWDSVLHVPGRGYPLHLRLCNNLRNKGCTRAMGGVTGWSKAIILQDMYDEFGNVRGSDCFDQVIGLFEDFEDRIEITFEIVDINNPPTYKEEKKHKFIAFKKDMK